MRHVTGICLAVIILGMFIISGCGTGEQQTKDLEPVTIAAYAGDTSLLAYLARDKGFFEVEGIDVTLKDFQAGKLAVDDLLAGGSHLALGADFVLVKQSFAYPELRVPASICESLVNHLVARKDHGIEQPKDLVGKRIGVTRGSAAEFYLGTFLLFEGVNEELVEIVDLTPNAIVEQLIAGGIDAGLTWEPNVYRLEQSLGDAVRIWPAQSGQPMYFIMLGTAGWMESHDQELTALLRALKRAETYVADNPTAARSYCAATFQLEPAYVERIWEKEQFILELPQTLLVQMGDQAKWLKDTGQVDAPAIPNYLDFVSPGALKEVDADAVTIIR